MNAETFIDTGHGLTRITVDFVRHMLGGGAEKLDQTVEFCDDRPPEEVPSYRLAFAEECCGGSVEILFDDEQYIMLIASLVADLMRTDPVRYMEALDAIQKRRGEGDEPQQEDGRQARG